MEAWWAATSAEKREIKNVLINHKASSLRAGFFEVLSPFYPKIRSLHDIIIDGLSRFK